MYLLDRFVKGLHWSNQAHFIGVTFLIFIAAWSNQGLLIFLLGGTKSLSQALVRQGKIFILLRRYSSCLIKLSVRLKRALEEY